jgi:hypothetical protein
MVPPASIKALKHCYQNRPGYIMEVSFRDLTPKLTLFLGIDMQVNDDQGSGYRDSIAKWNDRTNNF